MLSGRLGSVWHVKLIRGKSRTPSPRFFLPQLAAAKYLGSQEFQAAVLVLVPAGSAIPPVSDQMNYVSREPPYA